jgi:acyl carrier protein
MTMKGTIHLATVDLRATVVEIIAEEVGVPIETLKDNTTIESLVADSLEFLSVMTALRARFGDFPDSWMPSIKTVGNAVEMVEVFVNGVVSGRAI